MDTKTLEIGKGAYVSALINTIKSNNDYALVKSAVDPDLPNPARIKWKQKNVGYTPDVTVTLNNGNINVYEVELNQEVNIDKWNLFSLFAKKHNGQLYLAVPEKMLNAIENKAKEALSFVNIIYFT